MITSEQEEELKGFFLYMWNYHHNKKDSYYQREENDFSFYAQKLDAAGISWSVQNQVSALAEKRENGFKSFHFQLLNEISFL